MRHPIEKHNERQAEVLASLPDEQREYMARMFRIGNATYSYYNRANELAVFDSADSPHQPATDLVEWLEQHLNFRTERRSARELLHAYWEEYLEGLPQDGLRRAEKEAGLDKAKTSFPFRRYLLERHDIGMDEYLRQHLSEEDYAFHRCAGAVESGKPLTDDNGPGS